MRTYELPRWNDLPKEPVFNRDMVELINRGFSEHMGIEPALTETMVQNYVKWGMLPKPSGRKYGRKQLAVLIAICLMKEILPIAEVRHGVDLALRRMEVPVAYDTFAQCVEDAFRQVYGAADSADGAYRVEGFTANEDTFIIKSVAQTLALRSLTRRVFEAGGIARYGKEQR